VYPESLIALLFGCLQIFPSFFYMQALQNEEASKVTAMEYVYLIFVFIGSIFLFGEVLDPKCCAGGLLLIIGILILSYKKNGAIGKGSNSSSSKILASLMTLTPSIKPFLSYWILTAIYYLCLKFLLLSMDEWHLYIWSSLGSLIVVLPLMGKQSIRSEVTGFFAKGGIAVGALISEETLQFLGLIFSIFAYAIGSVTLVSSVGALQPIMTVLLILVLGVLAPKLAKEMNERTDRRSLLQKGISFMVVLIGIYFVS
jgi:drug/metabolite transporter (DMT)-like permease